MLVIVGMLDTLLLTFSLISSPFGGRVESAAAAKER
jgi:hypothetical protein